MHVFAMERTAIDNTSNLLLALPYLVPLIAAEIQAGEAQHLTAAIKNVLSLSSTCKDCNIFLSPDRVGKAFEYYSKVEKNAVMEKLLRRMHNLNYGYKRRKLEILIYAGADHNAYKDHSLFLRAIEQDDRDMITLLFSKKADPNSISDGVPDFFHVRNIETANMFITKKDFNVHAAGLKLPNVLWHLVLHYPSFELVKFYLSHNVKINVDNDNSIFHRMIWSVWSVWVQKNSEEFIKIAELLFKNAPEILNVRDKKGRTPLDVAKERLDNRYLPEQERIILNALVLFFEKCNAAQHHKQEVKKNG